MVAYGRLKTIENFKPTALKVVKVAYERWTHREDRQYSVLLTPNNDYRVISELSIFDVVVVVVVVIVCITFSAKNDHCRVLLFGLFHSLFEHLHPCGPRYSLRRP